VIALSIAPIICHRGSEAEGSLTALCEGAGCGPDASGAEGADGAEGTRVLGSEWGADCG